MDGWRERENRYLREKRIQKNRNKRKRLLWKEKQKNVVN